MPYFSQAPGFYGVYWGGRGGDGPAAEGLYLRLQ